jgi:hypothetical protein
MKLGDSVGTPIQFLYRFLVLVGIIVMVLASCTGLCTNFGIGKISDYRIGQKIKEFDDVKYQVVSKTINANKKHIEFLANGGKDDKVDDPEKA